MEGILQGSIQPDILSRVQQSIMSNTTINSLLLMKLAQCFMQCRELIVEEDFCMALALHVLEMPCIADPGLVVTWNFQSQRKVSRSTGNPDVENLTPLTADAATEKV